MLSVLALSCFGPAFGSPAPADFLFYGPLLSDTVYTDLLTAAGKTYTTVDATTWAAMTVDDFKQYRAIVLADPYCSGSPSSVDVPAANRATWIQAIDGNVVVIGTDERFHWTQGGSGLADSAMLYAGTLAGKTGLYVSLSCYYSGAYSLTAVPLLDVFTTTAAFAAISASCFNNVHIVATSPALTGLTDGILSGWSCSIHNTFPTYPPEFIPLAIANTGLTTDMSFADGTYGIPYILARGSTLSPLLCGDGVLQSTEECDDGNTVAGDGCNEKCKLEYCGDGIVNNKDEICDDGNTVSGDGCSDKCKLEYCGDGIVNNKNETCDDGNLLLGDGCTDKCTLEYCGDGIVNNKNETCDDGNLVNGDGCSSACAIENKAPDCSGAYIYTEELWPADCRFVHFGIRGVTDADGDDVFITVTSITQNQLTKSSKDDQCPDASIATMTLRVEREEAPAPAPAPGPGPAPTTKGPAPAPKGAAPAPGPAPGPAPAPTKNGRVYKITFTADDGHGGTCTGVVTTCVPQQNKCACQVSADDIWYDSTKC